MNKSNKLLNILEDMIDPDTKYPDISKEKNPNFFNSEKRWTQNTHNKLTKEAMRVTDQNSQTSPAAKAINNYCVKGYSRLNNHLRHGTDLDDEHKKHLEVMTGLTKNPTEHSFTAYRGMKAKHFDHSEGTTFTDKGFASTSLRPHIASGFAGKDKPKEEKNLYRIHITQGTKGHYISGHAAALGDGEREFVLHPNTTFRVGKTHDHEDGNQYTDLHIHSQEG